MHLIAPTWIKYISKSAFVFAFIFITETPDSWSQVSIHAQLGYAFPWAENDIPDGNITLNGNGLQEIELYKKSFGAGRYYTLSLSYPIATDFALGIQLSYLSGAKTSKTFDLIISNGADTYSGQMFWAAPQIQFEKKFRQLSPYIAIGPGLGLFGRIISDERVVTPSSHSESRTIYSKGMAYGVSSSLGATHFVGKRKKWKLSTEIRLISASFAPRRADLVKWNQNGTDILSATSIRDKTVTYKKSHIKDQPVPSDPNQPTVATIRYYPFSSVGLNVGIIYLL